MDINERTEIHRAVERRIGEIQMHKFIYNADNYIVGFFGLETEWAAVSDGISMKKYKCTESNDSYWLKTDDEILFIVDTNSRNVTFMSGEMDTLIVLSFIKRESNICINEDVSDDNLRLVTFLADMVGNLYKKKEGDKDE